MTHTALRQSSQNLLSHGPRSRTSPIVHLHRYRPQTRRNLRSVIGYEIRPFSLSCRAASEEQQNQLSTSLVGEDAAAFDVQRQSIKSWGLFFGLLTGVLGLLYVVNTESIPACDMFAHGMIPKDLQLSHCPGRCHL
jgi:hypothetical protein